MKTFDSERTLLTSIFLLALAVRALYVALFVGWETPPIYDGVRYDIFAVHILSGEFYGVDEPTAMKPPLYSLFLALVYLLFGHSLAAARMAQALLGSITCVLIHFVGKALFHRRVGLLASIGAALYPAFIFVTGKIYPETLLVFLLTLASLVSLRAINGSRRSQMALGVLMGASALTRPVIVFLLPFVVLWLFLAMKWRESLKALGAVIVSMLLVILPWTMRNYLTFHEFIPLSTGWGYFFWQGNNPFAYGGAVLATEETWGPNPPTGWGIWEGLSENQSSRRFFEAGIRWIKDNPGDFISLVPKKWARLLSPATHTTQVSGWNPELAKILLLPYLSFLLLALYGAVLSRRLWKKAFFIWSLIVSTFLATAIYYGGTRYAIPMAPALIVFAAVGVDSLANFAGLRSRPSQIGAGELHASSAAGQSLVSVGDKPTIKFASRNLLLICLISAYLIGGIFATMKAERLHVDANTYYITAQTIKMGEDFYDNLKRLEVGQAFGIEGDRYIYLPLWAVLFVPFTCLDPTAFAVLWYIINLAFLFLSTVVIFKAFRWGRDAVLPLAVGLLLFSPVLHTLLLGESNFAVLLALCTAFYLFKTNRKAGAGIALGLATIVKISPICLLLYFLWKKQLKVFFAGVVTIIALLGFSILAVGINPHRTYFTQVLPSLFEHDAFPHLNHSLRGFLGRIFSDSAYTYSILDGAASAKPIAFMLSALVVSITILACFPPFKMRGSFELEFSLVIIAMLLVSSVTWEHHLVWLVLPYAVLITQAKRQRLLVGLPAALSYVLIDAHRVFWFLWRRLSDLKLNPLLLSSPFYAALILWTTFVWMKFTGREG